jgi:hypothetical protein
MVAPQLEQKRALAGSLVPQRLQKTAIVLLLYPADGRSHHDTNPQYESTLRIPDTTT